jgi:hypothetical protein
MRFEPVPTDPYAGVVIESVQVTQPVVGQLHYEAGPPQTLSWTDAFMQTPPGMPVDVSKGGTFTLTASDGKTITVKVSPQDLATEMSPLDEQILVRNTLRDCFHFDVRNITLVATQHIPGGLVGPGWQTLATYLSEVPIATPQGSSVVDAVTATVRFIPPDQKTPNRPFIELTQDELVLLGGP